MRSFCFIFVKCIISDGSFLWLWLSGKYFLGFSVNGKAFLGRTEIPNFSVDFPPPPSGISINSLTDFQVIQNY